MVSSLIGRKLGKYEIVQLIGRGGMATVYKGYHREIDRYSAIKVLPPHPGSDPKFIQRFRQEARAIARLHHPNILTLYDYGSEDDILYLATAYVEGGSLNELIRPGGISLSRTEQIITEVALALDYAHFRGVIHRDIKPANILLDSEGRTQLADFGIAKLREDNVHLTDTSGVVGTPIYMAPEQSKGEPADFHADIYSLGIVIYELLTGQPPYNGTNSLDVILQHITHPTPSILSRRPDLPPALETVMQIVLAKKPADRYQTTQDFSEAFSRAIHGSMFHAQPPAYFDQSHTDTQSATAQAGAPATPQPTLYFTEQSTLNSSTTAHVYTFLFADIEDSTQLWERAPDAMSLALTHYDTVMSDTVEAHSGKIYRTGSESAYGVFDVAENALEAALAIQRLLYQSTQRPEMPLLALSVQMGIYSGQAEKRAKEFFGVALNRAARFMKAAHGGQILLSAATKELLPSETRLRDLGMHRLRDVNEPEHIFQAVSTNFPINTAPIHSLTPRPTNLPAQLTSFVGRQQNVEEICRLLRQPNLRLLSLLGTGGIGKTRLSIQVGTSLLDEYEDGVFFIPLAPLNQVETILKFIAQALDVQEDGNTALIELIKAHLQVRQLLLLFDNFEHVLDAAPLLNELLAAAARLKILVTSRESLFIYGEQTYAVAPLGVPEPDADVDALLRSAAAALFVERVQAMSPEFTLTDNNAASVAQICRQLDGLPLALELAAARVRDLTLAEIAEQLAERLALLSKGPRDMPMRQQTMRGAIDWSYRLLSAEEQQSFARLAVFESQFFAQSALVITGISDLQLLSNKSLLEQPAGQIFSMLTVLREYALERLTALGEAETIRQKHALYYCQWLEDAEPHLNGRDQIEWFSHMKVELYNLQAALEWFLQQQAVEDAGRMVAILWRYWATQSLLSEGIQWVDRVFAYEVQLPPLIHAKVAQGAGRLTLLRSDFTRSKAYQEASLTLYQSVHDQEGEAAVLQSLGETEYVQGNLAQAETYLEAGLSLNRTIHNEAGMGRCLMLMGKLAQQTGNFARAELLLEESLTLALAHGSSEAIALARYELGGVLRAQAKYPAAEASYRQSLALYEELNLAVGIGTMLYNLGFTFLGMGDHITAFRYLLDALKVLQPLDEPDALAECFIGLAGAFLHMGKPELATRILSAARAILTALNAEGQMSNVDQAEYDRIYAAAQVNNSQWQTDWSIGQSTSSEQIIKDIFREV